MVIKLKLTDATAIRLPDGYRVWEVPGYPGWFIGFNSYGELYQSRPPAKAALDGVTLRIYDHTTCKPRYDMSTAHAKGEMKPFVLELVNA